MRAARALLQWSAGELAQNSGVGIATIKRLETQNGVPRSQVRIILAIVQSLEAAGVEFVGTPDDGPGVRLRFPADKNEFQS